MSVMREQVWAYGSKRGISSSMENGRATGVRGNMQTLVTSGLTKDHSDRFNDRGILRAGIVWKPLW